MRRFRVLIIMMSDWNSLWITTKTSIFWWNSDPWGVPSLIQRKQPLLSSQISYRGCSLMSRLELTFTSRWVWSRKTSTRLNSEMLFKTKNIILENISVKKYMVKKFLKTSMFNLPFWNFFKETMNLTGLRNSLMNL